MEIEIYTFKVTENKIMASRAVWVWELIPLLPTLKITACLLEIFPPYLGSFMHIDSNFYLGGPNF